MRRLLGRLLRRQADRFAPQPPPNYVRAMDKNRKERGQIGLALNDHDVAGYLVVMLRVEEGRDPRIEVSGAVPNDSWPAFLETLDRVETMHDEFIAP